MKYALIIRRKNSSQEEEEIVPCETKQEARELRAESFANRNDVLFALIVEKEVALA